MPGKIKKIIDLIIEKKAAGNQILITNTKTKLILMGINPAQYDENSVDDPTVLEKLKKLANELNITI